jgi:hypothetical protein
MGLSLILTLITIPSVTTAQEAPTGPVMDERRPGLARRAAMFVPDRFLDMLDMVSVGLGVGYGFDVNRHLTYYMHVPTLGAYRSFNFFNWYPNRNLCWSINQEREAGILTVYRYNSRFDGGGTGWDNGEPGSGIKTYAEKYSVDVLDPIYQDGYRDVWALGVAYGPVILSPRIEFDIHPVEVADFAVGFLTLGLVDIRDDDNVDR